MPVDAFEGTTNDTCAEVPALIVRGQDGEQATPVGRPLMFTDTGLENPFKPVTETLTGALVVPVWVLTDEGETESEKSGGGMLIVVESLADTEAVMPPPPALTLFTCGDVALAATFTVTVKAG